MTNTDTGLSQDDCDEYIECRDLFYTGDDNGVEVDYRALMKASMEKIAEAVDGNIAEGVENGYKVCKIEITIGPPVPDKLGDKLSIIEWTSRSKIRITFVHRESLADE